MFESNHCPILKRKQWKLSKCNGLTEATFWSHILLCMFKTHSRGITFVCSVCGICMSDTLTMAPSRYIETKKKNINPLRLYTLCQYCLTKVRISGMYFTDGIEQLSGCIYRIWPCDCNLKKKKHENSLENYREWERVNLFCEYANILEMFWLIISDNFPVNNCFCNGRFITFWSRMRQFGFVRLQFPNKWPISPTACNVNMKCSLINPTKQRQHNSYQSFLSTPSKIACIDFYYNTIDVICKSRLCVCVRRGGRGRNHSFSTWFALALI